MKTCSKCRRTLPLDDFPRNRSLSGGRGYTCKQCHAAHARAYRRSDPDKERASAAFQATRRHFLQALKLTTGCIDCGYADDPARLHFDHRYGEVKRFNVAAGASRAWATLVAEIDKCDVRCVRCHAVRHQRLRRTPK